MVSLDAISLTGVFGVCVYYVFAWLFVGRDPKPGTIVPQYEPPSGLSPAMIRYIWKERFDDRTFWASALSLVARGLATTECTNSAAVLRLKEKMQHLPALPSEEEILLRQVRSSSIRKGMSLSLLDEDTAWTAHKMAEALRQSPGMWFQENREYVICGAALSLIAVALVARPENVDELIPFALGLGIMGPGSFYLFFLLMRLRDVFHIARQKLDGVLLRRALMLCGLAIPCLGGIVLGCVVLGSNFGWPTVAATALLTGLTVLAIPLMKAPTREGRVLLDKIEGFRTFLRSVESLPMNREQAPGEGAGSYEKYLPYAVALEVDQKWSDREMALVSTAHQYETLMAAHAFYLGMWNGNPVEMVFKPEPPKQY